MGPSHNYQFPTLSSLEILSQQFTFDSFLLLDLPLNAFVTIGPNIPDEYDLSFGSDGT